MKPGRNEPCPCGSKKKFKRCHGSGGPAVKGLPPELHSRVEDAALRQQFATYEPILRQSILFMEAVEKAAMGNREQAKRDYGLMLDAHMSVMGVIGNALQRHNGRPGRTDESVHQRLNLIASFMQGVLPCESAISEGYYAQAAALLRQEMETLAALEELKDKKRKDGKVPQIGGLPWGLKNLYGALSALTHVSKDEALTSLYQMESSGDARPASIVPLYNCDTARRMYGTHVAFLVAAALHLGSLHSDLYGEEPTPEEQMLILGAFELLRTEGFFVEAPEEGKPLPPEDPHWPQPQSRKKQA
jgi:hypothetical protein